MYSYVCVQEYVNSESSSHIYLTTSTKQGYIVSGGMSDFLGGSRRQPTQLTLMEITCRKALIRSMIV